MLRDGAKESIWQKTAGNYSSTNAWAKDDIYDLLIVGGGITGLTTALLLQEQGKKCILAEAANIGFGSTGGTTAHLNTFFDAPYNEVEKDFGADAAKLLAKAGKTAIKLIEDLATKYNIDCDFEYKRAYLFSEDDKQSKELEDIYNASERAGISVAWADGVPMEVQFQKAMTFTEQAQFHPLKYITGLAKAFEDAGGVILQHCLVNDIINDQHLVAETTLGKIHASLAVYATHIPGGINLLHFRCAPYRSYAMGFTTTDDVYPDALIYDMQDPYHYIRSQKIDGQQYIIAGGYDHKTGHQENTEYNFTELEAYARKYFDIDTIAWRWSSQYYIPADGLPYIGLLPGHNNIFTGTGYNGNGMVFGSLAGNIICDLITKGSNEFEKLFDPNRVKPVAGFANFIKENADVVSQFIGKRISIDKLKEMAELAPGDAVVTHWEGQKVAIHKDEQGHIYMLDPVCPHAKCIVAWNNAEHTWDCPCHGARYAPNGALLTGPAAKNLTQIKIEDLEGD